MPYKKISHSELSEEEYARRLALRRASQHNFNARHPERHKKYPRAPHAAMSEKDRDHINAQARARRLARGSMVRAVEQAYRDRYPERRREQILRSSKTYYAVHRAAILAQRRLEWQEDSSLLLRQKELRANNLDRARAKGRLARAKRRALERNVPINDFTAKQWRALCKAVGYLCAYCGQKFPFKQLTPDHITPLARGGSHTLPNIIPACLPCNRHKCAGDVLKPVQPFLLLPEDAAE